MIGMPYDWLDSSLDAQEEPITYKNNVLTVEETKVSEIVDQIGSPVYIYSTQAIERAYQGFQEAFSWTETDICYALKANGTLAVVATLARLGAGADVVSSGELARALQAGIPADRIVFSGVGKTKQELTEALQKNISQINIESLEELETLADVTHSLGRKATIGIRLNPGVYAKTHPKITTGRRQDKFGMDDTHMEQAFARMQNMPGVVVRSLAMHIGSQLMDLQPFQEACRILAEKAMHLRAQGYMIDRLDLGGGLGITYQTAYIAPSIQEYAKIIRSTVGSMKCRLILEPGRALVGKAGLLATRVIYIKRQNPHCFVILDAAMNDFMRPALYDAYHAIIPVKRRPCGALPIEHVDLVGTVCESSDTFAVHRPMPRLESRELIAILACGAYGAVMASEYNGRPRIAEVIVKDRCFEQIRPRQSIEQSLQQETLPSWLTS